MKTNADLHCLNVTITSKFLSKKFLHTLDPMEYEEQSRQK